MRISIGKYHIGVIFGAGRMVQIVRLAFTPRLFDFYQYEDGIGGRYSAMNIGLLEFGVVRS